MRTLRPSSEDEGFLALADDLARSAGWPSLIVVSSSVEGGNVLLEGHVRLTAMALESKSLPDEIEVLRGASPAMGRWSNY